MTWAVWDWLAEREEPAGCTGKRTPCSYATAKMLVLLKTVMTCAVPAAPFKWSVSTI